MTISINNSHVAEYYNHLTNIINNLDIPRDERNIANHKLQLLDSLIDIYEQNISITFEDLVLQDLGNPLLPEDKQDLASNLTADIERDKFTVVIGGKD